MGSLFSKASLAGLCTAVLTFAIGLITVASSLTITKSTDEMLGLSLVFPPYAWSMLVRYYLHSMYLPLGYFWY